MSISKLNTKSLQYKVCRILQQNKSLHKGILFFPLLLCRSKCSKNYYDDRIKFQISIYIDKIGNISLDNTDFNESGNYHPKNLSQQLPDIRKNCIDLIQIYDNSCLLHIDAFLIYLEDAKSNNAHSNSMLVITDKCSKSVHVFIFDPLGHSSDRNMNWWDVLEKKNIQKHLDIYVRQLLNITGTIHWHLPTSDLMKTLNPQRYELIKNYQKNKEFKNTEGFCAAWSIFFIHYIVWKIARDLQYVQKNIYIGINALKSHIQELGNIIQQTDNIQLTYIIKDYAKNIYSVIKNEDNICNLNDKDMQNYNKEIIKIINQSFEQFNIN